MRQTLDRLTRLVSTVAAVAILGACSDGPALPALGAGEDLSVDTVADTAGSADDSSSADTTTADTGHRDAAVDAGKRDGGVGDGDGGVPRPDTSGDVAPRPDGGATCGGLAGASCSSNTWCEYRGGDCGAGDGTGVCQPRPDPQSCPESKQPVCGCDGTTYDTACDAHAHGVDVSEAGECHSSSKICGGPGDETCGSGRFCDYPNGSCGEKDQTGTCIKPPSGGCTEQYQPVCGCDGQTHGNPCKAHSKGVDIDHPGKCKTSGACGGTTCGSDAYCKLPTGQCRASEAKKGTCTRQNKPCAKPFKPVCGCDGKTYGNECIAESNGVSIAHDGQCRSGSSCGGRTCGSNEYCRRPKGECQASEKKKGTCTRKPATCKPGATAVCGCDGNTYSSECEAASNGISIDHGGPCSGKTGCGPGGVTCRPTSYCDFPNDDCGTSGPNGTCSQRPKVCRTNVDPVCGCDSRTYNNECEANAAGVDIRHAGKCKHSKKCGGRRCGSDQFCRLPVGKCGQSRRRGMCTNRPQTCAAVVMRVCGCDGKTYSNPCEAYANGANIDHRGSC